MRPRPFHPRLLCALALGLSATIMLPGPAALARQPTGEGDPAAKSCMRIEGQTGHVGGDVLCKTNAEWAQMKADGVVLDQFGDPLPPPDARDVAVHGCTQTASGMVDKNGLHPMNFNCH